MAERTIPEPHPDDFRIAFNGLRTQAGAYGINRNDPAVAQFIQHMAEVQAQQLAEIRWLRNLIHKE